MSSQYQHLVSFQVSKYGSFGASSPQVLCPSYPRVVHDRLPVDEAKILFSEINKHFQSGSSPCLTILACLFMVASAPVAFFCVQSDVGAFAMVGFIFLPMGIGSVILCIGCAHRSSYNDVIVDTINKWNSTTGARFQVYFVLGVHEFNGASPEKFWMGLMHPNTRDPDGPIYPDYTSMLKLYIVNPDYQIQTIRTSSTEVHESRLPITANISPQFQRPTSVNRNSQLERPNRTPTISPTSSNKPQRQNLFSRTPGFQMPSSSTTAPDLQRPSSSMEDQTDVGQPTLTLNVNNLLDPSAPYEEPPPSYEELFDKQ